MIYWQAIKKLGIPLLIVLTGAVGGWTVSGWYNSQKLVRAQSEASQWHSEYDSLVDSYKVAEAEAQTANKESERLLLERILELESHPPEVITRIERVVERIPVEIATAGGCEEQVAVTARLVAEMHGGNDVSD